MTCFENKIRTKNMPLPSTKSLVQFTCIAILSEILYNFSSRLYRKLKNRLPPDSLTLALKEMYPCPDSSSQFTKVLFFPDSGLVCRRTASGRECKDRQCYAVHGETSLRALINVVRLARRNVDLCVYLITCSVLGDAVLDCQKRGIRVRVVTEERNSGEEGEVTGSQIGRIRAAGIPVRCRSTSFWMHHKFLVADDEILVNGSFNWTNTAVMGNLENLIITNDQSIVKPFTVEFQRLWEDLAFNVGENCV